jgi:negative regulator of sigma E activity
VNRIVGGGRRAGGWTWRHVRAFFARIGLAEVACVLLAVGMGVLVVSETSSKDDAVRDRDAARAELAVSRQEAACRSDLLVALDRAFGDVVLNQAEQNRLFKLALIHSLAQHDQAATAVDLAELEAASNAGALLEAAYKQKLAGRDATAATCNQPIKPVPTTEK